MVGDARKREQSAPDPLAPIRAFHERWGNTEVADLDQLALWEELGRLLRVLPGGAS